jgi:hypothetical protein
MEDKPGFINQGLQASISTSWFWLPDDEFTFYCHNNYCANNNI